MRSVIDIIFKGLLLTLLLLVTHCKPDKDELIPYYRDHSQLLMFLDNKGNMHPVHTTEDWQHRRNHILSGMQEVMGKLPDRTHLSSLDVQEIERLKGDGYTRLKISFVAEKDDRVPAYLYIPDQRDTLQRFPAILALHPTSPLGKGVVAGLSDKLNRSYALELAKRGYIVIAPDYPSFGDYTYDFGNDDYVSGTMKGIFNHMRCVDLLASREDVDPDRIGVIGHSLGGHNAMFVCVFDTRLKVIVSSCGWTPFHNYYEGDIRGWTSPRYMPGLEDIYELDPDLVPFDFYEVVAGLAPRSFFSNSPIHDSNFDMAGVKKAINEAQKVYGLLNVAENLQVRYPDCEHDFPPDVRLQAYEFIDKVLKHVPVAPGF